MGKSNPHFQSTTSNPLQLLRAIAWELSEIRQALTKDDDKDQDAFTQWASSFPMRYTELDCD